MDHIYIRPDFGTYLSFALIYFSMIVYFLLWKPRTKASTWLASLCLGFLISFIAWSFESLVPISLIDPFLKSSANGFGYFGMVIQSTSILLFSYHYRGTNRPKEAIVVLTISVVLTLIAFAARYSGSFIYFVIILVQLLIGSLWATINLLRKSVSFSKEESAGSASSFIQYLVDPQGAAAKSSRAFAGTAFLMFLLFVSAILVYVFPNVFGVSVQWIPVIFVLTTFWLFITYTNDFQRRSSLVVKLVGTAIFTTMGIIAVCAFALFDTTWINEQANFLPLHNQVIRFEPDPIDPTSYSYDVVSGEWHSFAGDLIELADEEDKVIRFDFDFPFYGQKWHDAHLSSNGLLSFGAPIRKINLPQFEPWEFYNQTPKIAALYTDLDPSRGTVYLSSSEDSLVVLMKNVPRFDSPSDKGMDIQIVLFPDGVIELSYSRINVHNRIVSDIIGIHPGQEAREITQIQLSDKFAGKGASLAGIVEDRNLIEGQSVHPIGARLAILILFMFFCVLLLYPWTLYGSILRPLKELILGVNQVKSGELDVEVKQSSSDEIGTLTTHFNEMAVSIKQANLKLREHADTLETKVQERTTELRQSLEDLQRAQQQLIQSEKMASLGQLTAGIAHEIKNPLNFVNNFSEMSSELLDEIREEANKYVTEIPESFRKALFVLLEDLEMHQEKINKHGRRADGIVQSMLAHSRNSPGEWRSMDLNKFADELIGLAYQGVKNANGDLNVLIERDFDPCIGYVEMMPQQLGQVLVNLLNNALYAVLERAKSLEQTYRPTITVCTRCEEDWAILEVRDNGMGISKRYQDRIFEPFFTTKPTGSGTGLGLSLSYDIITKGHDGELTVESEEGRGAQFTIKLSRKTHLEMR